jgi:hypothetical protein
MSSVTSTRSEALPAVVPLVSAKEGAMDPDRTCWGAREYADALNCAATRAEVVELAQEVNQKWAVARDLGPQPASSVRQSDYSAARTSRTSTVRTVTPAGAPGVGASPTRNIVGASRAASSVS